MYMRHILLPSVARPSLQSFSTLSHKRQEFKKKKTLLNTKYESWFSVQRLSETLLILRRSERDMTKNVHWSPCKVPVIFALLEWNLKFLDTFSKKYSNIEFHENLSSCRRVFPCERTERQTYMKKLIFAFRYFTNAPKNDLVHMERVRIEPQHAAIHTTCAHSQTSSSSSSSSLSSSPLRRVFILIFLRQTMSLGNIVLQLFCCYYSWCL